MNIRELAATGSIKKLEILEIDPDCFVVTYSTTGYDCRNVCDDEKGAYRFKTIAEAVALCRDIAHVSACSAAVEIPVTINFDL